MKNILTEITGRIDEMPRVSNTPYQLMKIVSRENFEIRELISVVESDVSLTAQCLRIINSAAYNLSRQINSIKQAVVLLGSRSLVDIAMSLAFKDIFTTSMNGYLAEKENFWEHSVRSALAARVLAKRLHHPVNPDLAYTAGLLHDIGKAVISEFLEKHHQELSEKVGGKFMGDFLNIEQDILETDHTIVGEAMARK